jgi:hypothetical protein
MAATLQINMNARSAQDLPLFRSMASHSSDQTTLQMAWLDIVDTLQIQRVILDCDMFLSF